ncbi:MAG: insulinase family protein [Nitrospirae bacterium]|nr:MAG: insulinase family protein [Nitrospirota bacterium]
MPVQLHRLANGLRVVTLEAHATPIAVVQIWYHVGSKDEVPGKTGLAHLLEHSMFNGTRRHGPGEHSRLVARAGGDDNAFTSFDYTAYFEKLPAARLDLGLELEADRMRNLLLGPEEFARERRVVQEERRMRTEDDPESALVEQVRAASFLAHPYGQPVIGWMGDIAGLTVADLRAFYDRYYRPDNAVLVVVGDFRTADLLARVERAFGAIHTPPTPRRRRFHEPEQRGARRVTLRRPAKLPFVYTAYHVPTFEAADGPALEVAAQLLAGGKSGRLNRVVVEARRIALYAGAAYDGDAEDPALFTVYAGVQPDHTPEEAEAALAEQVARLGREPVGARELARAKTQLEAAFLFAQDSPFYLATTLGRLYTTGRTVRDLEAYVPRVRAVTAAQVVEAAARYLRPERCTTGVLLPEAGAAPPPAPPAGGPVR